MGRIVPMVVKGLKQQSRKNQVSVLLEALIFNEKEGKCKFQLLLLLNIFQNKARKSECLLSFNAFLIKKPGNRKL